MGSFYLAANALIERNGKYLIVEEGKDHVHGTWNIPGGGVEPGENPAEAVMREIKEETGLEAEVGNLINVLTGTSDRDGNPTIVFVFRATVEAGEPEPVLDQEVLNAEFKSEEEIKDIDLRNDVALNALKADGNFEGLEEDAFSEFRNF